MGAQRTFFWESLPPEKLWYLVGLITSDGCLSPDGRHIIIVAKERAFLELLKSELKITSSVGSRNGGWNTTVHYLQIGSKTFYQFLQDIGLTPNKSKTLCEIIVPYEQFKHFFRGIIDGDGCIRKWQHFNSNRVQRYFKINSGSEKFLFWLNEMLLKIFGASGSIYFEKYLNTTGYILKISKKSYIKKILEACYQNKSVALPRKRAQALECINAISPGGGMVDTRDS